MTSVRAAPRRLVRGWSPGRRAGMGVALAAAGAAGLICSFPPVGAWPLIFVAFVPILYAQHVVLPGRWAGLAAVVGWGGYIAYLTWGALTPMQRPGLLLLVPVLWFGGHLDRRWQQATNYRSLWWSGPVCWTAALFLIGLSPLASWVDPAYALYRQPWLIQPVGIVAISGLNLLILLINYATAAALLAGVARYRSTLLVGAAILLTCWTVLSALLLGAGRSGSSVKVAAIQPGAIAHVGALTPADRMRADARILAQLEATTTQVAQEGAQLVVWPEQALQYFDATAGNAAQLRNLVERTHIYLVIGYSPDPRRLNQATVLDPSGRFLGVYNKQHPVFFAGDHSVGGPVVVMDTTLGRIAPIICYDLDFENTGRAAARLGAGLLAVPSEDWAGIANQHYTHLVFRAVENHVAAVKADTAWDSAIIDPEGRILAAHVTTNTSSSVLLATVPAGTGHSPFTVAGNWTGWLCVGLTAAWVAVAVRAQARRPHRR